MSSTVFTDGVGPPISAAWLNDVNQAVYNGSVIASSIGTTGSPVVVNTASPPTAGQVLTASSPLQASWVTPTGGGGGGGTGTVTSVGVILANGFSGTVATPTTTPSITISTSITGLLKGVSGSLEAAINADLPVMSSTIGGAVPTPPNNTTTFLRGDGVFATPPTSSPAPPVVVGLLAVLRASAVPTTPIVVVTTGYLTIADGGQGLYFWDSTSTTADNGGTVIACTANGSSAGRFLKLF